MDSLDSASTVFHSRVAEVRDILSLHAAGLFFSRHRQELFPRDMRPELKKQLDLHLKIKGASGSVLFRGLILQLYGSFERFIRDMTASVLDTLKKKHSTYSQIDRSLRDLHTVGLARILVKLQDNAIDGFRYDFIALQSNMGACFSDSPTYRLDADAFTYSMGIMSPDRLDKLFENLDLGVAFDDHLARSLKGRWINTGGARELKKLAHKTLSDLVRLRNKIAHGALDPEVQSQDVEDYARFLESLVDALTAKVRAKTEASDVSLRQRS